MIDAQKLREGLREEVVPARLSDHVKCDGFLFHWRKGVVRCQHGATVYEIQVGHDCWDSPLHYETDGPLGDAYECGRCGALLQVG